MVKDITERGKDMETVLCVRTTSLYHRQHRRDAKWMQNDVIYWFVTATAKVQS